MDGLLDYTLKDGIAILTMDDGKVNAMSPAMLDALHAGLDRAEADGAVVWLRSTARVFSAGFDLAVFAQGTEAARAMMHRGATLAERILGFPFPVIASCAGHAYPMGAFLIMSADLRLAGDGDFTVGMNEVTISMTLPQFAIEIARQRLTPAAFNRCLMTGEMLPPAQAMAAGFVDRVVPMADLDAEAEAAARALTAIDMKAHRASKLKARRPALDALRAAIEAELSDTKALEAALGAA